MKQLEEVNEIIEKEKQEKQNVTITFSGSHNTQVSYLIFKKVKILLIGKITIFLRFSAKIMSFNWGLF